MASTERVTDETPPQRQRRQKRLETDQHAKVHFEVCGVSQGWSRMCGPPIGDGWS